ncbi:MAG: hypothetical protein EDM75_15890, partial [Chlorobiota bacterium]
MKNNKTLIAVFFFAAALVFAGCENKIATGEADEPTMGKKKIAVDETFKPVFEELEKQFESLYPNAELTIIYAPESQVVDLLLKDSVPIIFIARDLSDAEKSVMEKKGIAQRTTPVAYDGVAMLVGVEVERERLIVDGDAGLLARAVEAAGPACDLLVEEGRALGADADDDR